MKGHTDGSLKFSPFRKSLTSLTEKLIFDGFPLCFHRSVKYCTCISGRFPERDAMVDKGVVGNCAVGLTILATPLLMSGQGHARKVGPKGKRCMSGHIG